MKYYSESIRRRQAAELADPWIDFMRVYSDLSVLIHTYNYSFAWQRIRGMGFAVVPALCCLSFLA